MRNRIHLMMMVTALMLFSAGCASNNPRPPSAAEQKFFNITTNQIPVVEQKPVVVPGTNDLGLLVTTTNYVTVTNYTTGYTFTPSQDTRDAITATGALVNTVAPGVGTIVASALAALAALWGGWRSSRKSRTANAMAQEIEALRVFIQSLPNGAKYDQAIVGWLQTHQMEMGEAATILKILEKNVSNAEAQAAAAQIRTALEVASGVVTPVPPKA